jgi:hypothetical protein
MHLNAVNGQARCSHSGRHFSASVFDPKLTKLFTFIICWEHIEMHSRIARKSESESPRSMLALGSVEGSLKSPAPKLFPLGAHGQLSLAIVRENPKCDLGRRWSVNDLLIKGKPEHEIDGAPIGCHQPEAGVVTSQA